MAKSLLKKAKKVAKSVKKEVEILAELERKKDEIDAPALPVSAPKAPNVSIRDHIEKLSGDRRDCASIWTLIKHDSSIYKTDDEIKTLIKSKGYETLLGEIS